MPKTYRRKRATRAKRRPTRRHHRANRKGGARVSLSRGNALLPEKVNVNMDWWYQGAHGYSVGNPYAEITFLGDPYNPGYSILSTQPALFDNLLAIWNRGRVVKMITEVTVTNNSTETFMLMTSMFPNGTLGTWPLNPSVYDWKALPSYARSSIKILRGKGNTGDTQVIKKTYYPGRMVDDWFTSQRSEFSSSFSAQSAPYIGILATNTNYSAGGPADFYYTYRIRFVCEMSTPGLWEMATLD